MFIEYPHDFTCVHCRTSAQCNDYIRLKQFHSCRTLFCRGKSWVRLYVIETSMLNAQFVKLAFDRLYIAVFIKKTVCYNKCFFLAHHAKFIKCQRHTALFEIDFLRSSEPKHIFTTFRNSLDIQKMFYTDIFRNGVSAP